MNNVETVRSVYDNFSKQNIPAILECMAEDVDWEYAYADSPIPWLKRRRGRDGAGEFFQSLGALDITRFEVRSIVADGSLVIAIVSLEAVVRATGKRIVETDEVHLWHFDGRGRVARFRHVVDTLQHANALKAS
jgi:ketosteroid isomerase-like protein